MFIISSILAIVVEFMKCAIGSKINADGFAKTKGSRVLTYYSNEIVGFEVGSIMICVVIKDLLRSFTGLVDVLYLVI